MSSSSFIDGEWTVQRSMSLLLPIGANPVGANDAPLLRFKCHFLAPIPDMVAELSSRMPLYQFDDLDEAAHSKSQCDVAEVRWRLSRHKLETTLGA